VYWFHAAPPPLIAYDFFRREGDFSYPHPYYEHTKVLSTLLRRAVSERLLAAQV
jgi:hypothetical protein